MADIQVEINRIRATNGVLDSAKLFIETAAERLTAAVEAALLNGATEAQLQPLRDEIALQESKASEVASAIAANP